jgi:predicted dinucleotide-binding enzyme
VLSATNTEHAQQAAGERAEAVAGADVVVLAVPYAALDDIARELSDVLTGKEMAAVIARGEVPDIAVSWSR